MGHCRHHRRLRTRYEVVSCFLLVKLSRGEIESRQLRQEEGVECQRDEMLAKEWAKTVLDASGPWLLVAKVMKLPSSRRNRSLVGVQLGTSRIIGGERLDGTIAALESATCDAGPLSNTVTTLSLKKRKP